jgi:hypothetical protein
MLALSKKCTTQIDLSIPYLYLKRIKIGEYVLIILILTRRAKKIHSVYPKLIRSWTPQLTAAYKVSMIVIRVSIRFPLKNKIKSRRLSLFHSVLFLTQ